MLKKITILLLGLVVLSGCYIQTTNTEVDKEITTDKKVYSTPKIEEAKIEENIENDTFYMINSFENVDFDYNAIDNFYTEDCHGGYVITSTIHPVEGNYNINYFVRTFEIEPLYGYPGGTKHNILAIKTNKDGKILDAYSYIYEYAECPTYSGLSKASDKIIQAEDYYLEEDLNLNDLEFSDNIYYKTIDGGMKDVGIDFSQWDISLKKNINIPEDINFSQKYFQEKKSFVIPISDKGIQFFQLSQVSWLTDDTVRINDTGDTYKKSEENGTYYKTENREIFTNEIMDEDQDTFYLLDSFENVNFDYNKIEKFYNTCDEQYSFITAISPIKGSYNIDYFLRTFATENPHDRGAQWTLHVILAVKTNEENEILDAYYYMYDLGECPRDTGLYKASNETLENNKILLNKNLDVRDLDFVWYNNHKSYQSVDFIDFKKKLKIKPEAKSKIDFSFEIKNRDKIRSPLDIAKPFSPFCYLTKEEDFQTAEETFFRSEKNGIYYIPKVLIDFDSRYEDIDYHLAETMNEYLKEKYDIPLCNHSNNYDAVRLMISEPKSPEELFKELEAEGQNIIEYKIPQDFTILKHKYDKSRNKCISYLITEQFILSFGSLMSPCDYEINTYVEEFFQNEFANFAEKYDIKPYPEETIDIKVYFSTTRDNENIIDCRKTESVTRTIPKTTSVASAALEQLFIGPTEEEMGEGMLKHHWVNDSNYKNLLKRVFVKENTIYLDWVNFEDPHLKELEGANSSCGYGGFSEPIENTLLQFPNIEKVIHAFNGSPRDFYGWSQMGCEGRGAEYCDPTPFQ